MDQDAALTRRPTQSHEDPLCGNVLKTTVAGGEIALALLTKGGVWVAVFINVARYVSIDDGNIKAAVPIEVQETSAEPNERPARRAQARTMRHIQKAAPAEVFEERIGVTGKSRGDTVRQAHALQIVHHHAH